MPYSIQTKDGIKINNIPDDIAPDSQELKDRVAQIRAGEGQQSQPTPTPSGAMIGRSMGQAAGQSLMGGIGQAVKAPFSAVGEMITGRKRKTELTESLPELQTSGLLSGESDAKVAAISPVLLATFDPNEIAQIITSNFPNVGVVYNKDAKGNVIPVLRNNETGAATIINRPGMSGLDALQAIGIGAAFTPAGRAATVAGAGAKAAGTEAAIQGAQELSGGDFTGTDVLLSGGLGFGTKFIEKGLGAAARASRGSVDDAVVQAGKDSGIPVMTSDVISPETFAGKMAQQITEKIPIFGTGGARSEQQQMRVLAVDEVAKKYGDFSYGAIVDSLKSKKDAYKRGAGNVIEATGKKLDEFGTSVPAVRTRDAIQNAKRELSKPGVIRSESAMDDLDKLIKAIDETPQNFTSLKENRTAFREIVKSTDRADRSQLTSRAKALLSEIDAGMSADMKSFALQNLSQAEYDKWVKANNVYAREAEELTKTKVKTLLDTGDITPEKVNTMLFSQNESDMRRLYNGLRPEGRANARAAIISRVFDKLGGRSSGVTPNSFASELKKYDKEISIFFKGEERAQLEGLRRVLESTRRAQDAAVTTPTGQQLIGGLSIAGLYVDPLASLGLSMTIGGLSRLYESAPVRNALLRLASVPKGSTQYEKALAEAATALSVAAQTARSSESDSK